MKQATNMNTFLSNMFILLQKQQNFFHFINNKGKQGV